jgi:uncharacterized protein YodC (DUF2158 family)
MSVLELRTPTEIVNIPQTKYQLGDVVVLKSGGPTMTIRILYPPKGRSGWMIETDWFNDCEHWSGEFFEEELINFADIPKEDLDEIEHS